MIRTASASLLVAVLACTATGPAQARRRAAAPDKPVVAKPDAAAAAKPVQVGTFGDWGAYLAKGKSKTCYALAKPTDRKGEGKKESAYIFIADRPAEKVRNEVSIIMGFAMKESGSPTAKIGTTSYDLVSKGQNAWIKNPDDEAKFVDALKHNFKLTVKAAPQRGPVTTDTYTLTGFKPALERVTKDCR